MLLKSDTLYPVSETKRDCDKRGTWYYKTKPNYINIKFSLFKFSQVDFSMYPVQRAPLQLFETLINIPKALVDECVLPTLFLV